MFATPLAISRLVQAASQTEAAFALAVKVSGNRVLNWMYVDVAEIRFIAAMQGEISFQQADNSIAAKQTLRTLVRRLSRKTPFLALMIRYDETKPVSWEFVNLDFLKNLTD